jgi:dienelactone hydrolase
MKKTRIQCVIIFVAIMFLIGTGSLFSQEQTSKGPRPLEDIQDIMAWKSIRSATVSNNGEWFAYRLSPQEGDSQVVIRKTKEEKEYTFPAGEVTGYSRDISFSDDSNWVAFTVYPKKEEARKLTKQRKKAYNSVILVNLKSGEKQEFEKIDSYAFSGEESSWIALHKYAPERKGMPGETGGEEERGAEKDEWRGSDLILHELASGANLNIGNVAEFSFNKKGQWLSWIVDAQEKTGNGVQLRNMKTGVILPIESDKAVYKRLTWTEEGDGLTVLKGKDNDDYEDKLYSVLGFTGFDSASPGKVAYDPKDDPDFPKGMTISPNRNPLWTEDLNAILFGIHEAKIKEKKEKGEQEKQAEEKGEKEKKEEDKEESPKEKSKPEEEIDKEDLPDLVIWHWKDKRLQSMQQVQEQRDKNFSYLCVYRVDKRAFIRLGDEKVPEVSPAPKQRWAIGLDDQKYELMGNLEGRRFQDIYIFDLETGECSLALRKCRWYFGPSPDGTHFLFYQDGHYYTYEMATGKTYNITKQIPTSFIDEEDDHNVVNPPIYPYYFGWAKDGVSVLLYDNWDVWNVPVHGGQGVNLTVNGKKEGIRYQRYFQLDPDEKGIDLSQPLYISVYGEWTKKGGVALIEKGKPGAKMLLWDDAIFSILKAEDADVFLYTKQTYKDYPDYYVTDSSLKKGQKITEANPQQKDFFWSDGVMLLDYMSTYKVNDPGMSAVWCVLPALEAAVATGVVDKDRVGLHGHSWGGYQTAFLITQTDAFRAAVAGAPLTNMISMYSSIYWNSGSANQPIFESSQGRFKGGYWDNLEAYSRNSPVYYAQNVKSPLLLLHNDKDGAVDWNQGIEYFNTLRRLDKPVVMLQYVGENHGLRKVPNQKDYTMRMREFFDYHLMGKPVPKWLEEGISHLDLKEHIKERTKEIIKSKSEEKK